MDKQAGMLAAMNATLTNSKNTNIQFLNKISICLGTMTDSDEGGSDHSSWIEGVAILVCVVVVVLVTGKLWKYSLSS